MAGDVCRKTAREESPPREEIAMPESTPALVSSGFKRRQALKAVQVSMTLITVVPLHVSVYRGLHIAGV